MLSIVNSVKTCMFQIEWHLILLFFFIRNIQTVPYRAQYEYTLHWKKHE